MSRYLQVGVNHTTDAERPGSPTAAGSGRWLRIQRPKNKARAN